MVSALQAKLLALQGRGGDTEIAHVAPGEVVVPRNLQTPAVMRTLAAEAMRAGIDPRRYTVGHRANSVNPRTGTGEYAIEEIVVTHPGYGKRGSSGGGSFTLPASFSYYDTIEGGIAKAIQFLKGLGFEIQPDGSLKGPNGEIIPAGTQIVESTPSTRRARHPVPGYDGSVLSAGPGADIFGDPTLPFINPIRVFLESMEKENLESLRQTLDDINDYIALSNDSGLTATAGAALAAKLAQRGIIAVSSGPLVVLGVTVGGVITYFTIDSMIEMIDSILASK